MLLETQPEPEVETHEERVARVVAEIHADNRAHSRAAEKRYDAAHRDIRRTSTAARRAADPVRAKKLAVAHARAQRNQPDYSAKRAAWRLSNKYGLTPAQKAEMLTAQGGVCGICGTDDQRKGRWVVEHDHVTRKVRSVSHMKCNAGFGFFLEDPAALRAAADYAEKHKWP